MKKFTSLLLLLLTMFLWGGVDVVAQTFEVSEAPSNGQWAENTHWYTIKNKKGKIWYYLSTASDCTDVYGNLMIKGTVKSAQSLWCVVQDGTGYKFYNFVEGPSKVLGMIGDEDSGRAKMCDETTTNGVWTTFYSNSTKAAPDNITTAVAFRVDPSGVKYWNERNGYLAFWKDNRALAGPSGDSEGCVGSAFVFESVNVDEELNTLLSTTYDNLVSDINSYKSTYSSHLGQMFCFPEESLNNLPSTSETKPTGTDELLSAIQNFKTGISQLEASRIMPEIGKYYKLRTKEYSDKYLHASMSLNAKQLRGYEADNQTDIWKLEAGSISGTYRLQNVATQEYINASNVGSGASRDYNASLNHPTDFTLFYNDVYAGETHFGTTKIGTGYRYSNLHIDGGKNLVSWESANASSWYFENVSDEILSNIVKEDSKVVEAVEKARILPVWASNVNSTFEAYQSDKTQENAAAFLNAVEASTYVRIKNRQTNLGLGVLDDFSHANCNDWSMGDAGLIWKLQPIDDNGTLKLKLLHLNTHKYLGPVGTNNPHSDAPMRADLTSGATWSFTPINTNYFTLRDGANGVMNCEDGANKGKINQWNNGVNNNQTQWTVEVAENIEVALKAVGDHTYATTFLPFPVSAVSEGVKAYTGSYDAAQKLVTLKETAAIPVNTGVVLMGETAFATTATLTIGGNATMTEKSDFEGTTTAIALDDNNRSNYLVLGKKSGAESEIGFFKPLASKIPANRAYINNVNGNAVSSVNVNFGTVEGIGSVVTETAEDANSPIFDLSGRRVMHTMKGGLYIRNGKKVINN